MKSNIIIFSFLFAFGVSTSFADSEAVLYDSAELESSFNNVKSLAMTGLTRAKGTYSQIITKSQEGQTIVDEMLQYFRDNSVWDESTNADLGDMYLYTTAIKGKFKSIADIAEQGQTAATDYISYVNNATLPQPLEGSNGGVYVDMGIVTNIYNVMALAQDNMWSVQQEMNDTLSDIYTSISRISFPTNNGSSGSSLDYTQKLQYIFNSLQTSNSLLSFILGSIDDLIHNYMDQILSYVTNIDMNTGLSRIYLNNIQQILSGISSNRVQGISGTWTNMFSRPNSTYQFDRFSSKLRPTNQANAIDFVFRGPYDSQQHIMAANLSSLLAGGFSNSLIQFGSINNYLYYLERLAASNMVQNSEFNAYLASISNLNQRLDSYVLDDFSNQFSRLSVVVESLTNQLVIANGISTNNFASTTNYLSQIANITNYLGMIYSSVSTNFPLIVDNLTSNMPFIVDSVTNLSTKAEEWDTAWFKGQNLIDSDSSFNLGSGSYYDYFTNRYISGVDGANSNWFERVETLLAAIAFGLEGSSTNDSSTVESTSEVLDQVRDLMNSSLGQNEQQGIIELATSESATFIGVFQHMNSTIASLCENAPLTIGWGDSDTTKTEDLLAGHFRVTVNSEKMSLFTTVCRGCTSLVWLLLVSYFVIKAAAFLLSKGFYLWQLMRSLLSSIWGR